jgi:hypothetical protein
MAKLKAFDGTLQLLQNIKLQQFKQYLINFPTWRKEKCIFQA